MPEFDHISFLQKKFGRPNGDVVKSVGDDCAVIDRGDFYELITTDMLVDGDHFLSRNEALPRSYFSTSEQIGMKAMEVNISDIAAMGGVPEYAVISLCLTGKEEKDFLEKLYKGIEKSCSLRPTPLLSPLSTGGTILYVDTGFFWNGQVKIIGGDITKGSNLVINVAMIGRVEKKRCVFRSGAKAGDLICVTGSLGGSWAGLSYLRKYGFPSVETRHGVSLRRSLRYCLQKYFEPKSRFLAGRILSKYATAMIDVSDGLGSEVWHICEESGVAAVVYEEKIPMAKEVLLMAEYLSQSEYPPLPPLTTGGAISRSTAACFGTGRELALHWALSGGEDFELVFTVAPDNLKKLQKQFSDFTVVGEITKLKAKSLKLKAGDCWLVLDDGKKVPLPGGYEHEV